MDAVAQRDLALGHHPIPVDERQTSVAARLVAQDLVESLVGALAPRPDDRRPHDAGVRRQRAQRAAHPIGEDARIRAVVRPETDDERLRRVLREIQAQRLHALRGRPAGVRVERHLAIGDHVAEKRPHADGERVADDQHLRRIGVRDARPRAGRARDEARSNSHAQPGDHVPEAPPHDGNDTMLARVAPYRFDQGAYDGARAGSQRAQTGCGDL